MKLYSNMLKIGIVGIGEHSWNNILPSLIQIPNILTISVCDIDENKANLAALKYNARAYYGYKQMIKHEKLDVIIIASHPKVHYEVAKMALKKDIAVFIEKPPTFNLKELKTLIKIKKQQTITGVGLNFNYAETINIVDELAKKENFGQIKYLSISHYSNKPKKPFWGIKSLVKSFLLSQAIHPIGFMLKY